MVSKAAIVRFTRSVPRWSPVSTARSRPLRLPATMGSRRRWLCNAAHPVEARIARWLLEVLDRSGGFDVPLTQSTLAHMLGVQRTTVNLAAGRLEAGGVINCRRGYMQVVRREQLERHACECYRSVKAYVSRLHALPPAAAPAAEVVARKPA